METASTTGSSKDILELFWSCTGQGTEGIGNTKIFIIAVEFEETS
jgi:hypothetical protein